MKKENQKLIGKFKYVVRAYGVYDGADKNSETEFIIGDTHWLVSDIDPSITGIDCFSDIPERLDGDGNWESAYNTLEEYWEYLTDLHVSEIDGKFCEDAREKLWYFDGVGWWRVSSGGELSRDGKYDFPHEVEFDENL